jgi:hypothetical protein
VFWICRIFSKSGINPCQNAASLTACPGETPQRQLFFRRPVCQRLSLLQIFCTQLSKVETVNIISLNIQPFWPFSDWVTAKVANCGISLEITVDISKVLLENSSERHIYCHFWTHMSFIIIIIIKINNKNNHNIYSNDINNLQKWT